MDSFSNNRDAEEAANPSAETTGESNRPVSPPPNCVICLSGCEDRCFADSCMHQFCFACLVKWSKIKQDCPLCKQPLQSIIHNVRSMDDYDRYQMPSVPEIPEGIEHYIILMEALQFSRALNMRRLHELTSLLYGTPGPAEVVDLTNNSPPMHAEVIDLVSPSPSSSSHAPGMDKNASSSTVAATPPTTSGNRRSSSDSDSGDAQPSGAKRRKQ